MSVPHISRHMIAWIYRVVRILVRLIFVLVILGLLLFIYLRVQGVPGPLLREVTRRANEAGIPVSVEGITLTLNGWRADHVRYYSNHPDDLDPMFESEQVFFSVMKKGKSKSLKVEVKAVGVRVAPSVEWGISIPADSRSREIEHAEVILDFRPEGVVLSDGRLEWLGSKFKINGIILKETQEPRVPSSQSTVSPVLVTAAQFQMLEDRLKMLSLPTGATIDITFEVDSGNYAASRLNFSAHAEGLAFRAIEFSGAKVSGNYVYPLLRLEQASLFVGKQSVQLSGEYNMKTQKVEGTLFNSITSNRLMLLLPESAHELLTKANLRIDHLPHLNINFGPAVAKELLNQLSGTFSIRSVGYQGLEIDTLVGEVERRNNRIEFTNLQGLACGQEERASEAGSTMHGGTAEGIVFWDGNTREFGVDINAQLDPNLLVQALSPVKIATNIIQYFSFKDQPPLGHVTLGANVDDWSTFYIDIQAVANDVAFREVQFSSINVTQTYRNGKLGLDPVAVVQGAEFAKGSVEVDFRSDTVSFDVESSLQLVAIENMIHPGLDLFGDKRKTQGETRLSARGIVDWGSMIRTDFSAQVSTDALEIPVGIADDFQAEVVGKGPLLSVREAQFMFYGGPGSGSFQIELDPTKPTMLYAFDAACEKVNFKKFVDFYRTVETQVSGALSGKIHIEADMTTNFFSTATGIASIRVSDGQLADLPFFSGFTKLMRKMIPSFKAFSITSLNGDFTISKGEISSEKVDLAGDIISASGRGSYHPDSGFDAKIQAHILRGTGLSKVLRMVTDPLMKLFEMKVTGPFSDPSWRLENLP